MFEHLGQCAKGAKGLQARCDGCGHYAMYRDKVWWLPTNLHRAKTALKRAGFTFDQSKPRRLLCPNCTAEAHRIPTLPGRAKNTFRVWGARNLKRMRKMGRVRSRVRDAEQAKAGGEG